MNHNNKLKVFSGRANVPLAEKIAQYLGDPLGKLTLQNFPDGEFLGAASTKTCAAGTCSWCSRPAIRSTRTSWSC